MFILINAFLMTFGALLKAALVIAGGLSAVALFAWILILLASALAVTLTTSQCRT